MKRVKVSFNYVQINMHTKIYERKDSLNAYFLKQDIKIYSFFFSQITGSQFVW